MVTRSVIVRPEPPLLHGRELIWQRVRVQARAKLGQSPVQNEAKHGDKEHQEEHLNVFLRRRGCGHASSLRRCSGEPRAQPADTSSLAVPPTVELPITASGPDRSPSAWHFRGTVEGSRHTRNQNISSLSPSMILYSGLPTGARLPLVLTKRQSHSSLLQDES